MVDVASTLETQERTDAREGCCPLLAALHKAKWHADPGSGVETAGRLTGE